MSNDNAESRELKPCPFCGGDVEWGTSKFRTGPGAKDFGERVTINCKTKGCRHVSGGWHKREHAIKHWNTRPQPRFSDKGEKDEI